MADKKSSKDKKQKKDARDERIEELELEVKALTNDLQRIQADFVNYKRSQEDQLTRQRRHGAKHAVLQLLPALDSLTLAMASQPEDLKDHPYVKGIAGTAKQLSSALERLGVQRLEVKDEAFDPELMEAVSVEGDGEHEYVSEELQAGYTYDGEVIRPAIVKVELR